MEKVNDLLLEDEEMETILTLDKLLNYARIGMKYTKEINSKFVELDFEKEDQQFYLERIKELDSQENSILMLQNSLDFKMLSKDICSFFNDKSKIKK